VLRFEIIEKGKSIWVSSNECAFFCTIVKLVRMTKKRFGAAFILTNGL